MWFYPGMVMAAADLLKTNSKPTELEIRKHLGKYLPLWDTQYC